MGQKTRAVPSLLYKMPFFAQKAGFSSATFISAREIAPLNAADVKRVTEEGIVIEVSFSQFSKALSSMDSKEEFSAKVIFVTFVKSLNA